MIAFRRSHIEVRAGLADRIPCSVPGIFGNEDQNPSPTLDKQILQEAARGNF